MGELNYTFSRVWSRQLLCSAREISVLTAHLHPNCAANFPTSDVQRPKIQLIPHSPYWPHPGGRCKYDRLTGSSSGRSPSPRADNTFRTFLSPGKSSLQTVRREIRTSPARNAVCFKELWVCIFFFIFTCVHWRLTEGREETEKASLTGNGHAQPLLHSPFFYGIWGANIYALIVFFKPLGAGLEPHSQPCVIQLP